MTVLQLYRHWVSQSWIRGVSASSKSTSPWPSQLSAFPTWVPVNTNIAMNSGSRKAESNTLLPPQNKQGFLWTVADQTLEKYWSPVHNWCLQKMTWISSVWLLVLLSADEDGCNQGSGPPGASRDIKAEAILHNRVVSTMQFMALEKAKAARFLKPTVFLISYQFATGCCQIKTINCADYCSHLAEALLRVCRF